MPPNSFSPAKAKVIDAFKDALQLVAGESISLEVLIALLTIALEPGLSVNELADRLGVPQQTGSRYAAILLGRYQEPDIASRQQTKWPLVHQEVHAEDPRKRAMFLTERGKEFTVNMLSRLTGGG